MIRRPAVSGQFYYAEPERLSKQVAEFMEPDAPREAAKAVLCPHAGFFYSGAVAGAVYSRIIVPETFILIGPNHTGLGAKIALWAEGRWEVPTGAFDVDEGLSEKISRNSPLVRRDTEAHMFEHSIEVQLPFIAHISKGARIAPIAVMSASLEELKAVGEGLAKSVAEAGYPVLIVASSDMSHFISDAQARSRDRLALDMALALDPEGLYDTVRRESISMCGYMPAVMMLYAARAMGAKEASLVKYATSAEVSGDYDSVVGYAGVIVK
jgi:hypothetical protein